MLTDKHLVLFFVLSSYSFHDIFSRNSEATAADGLEGSIMNDTDDGRAAELVFAGNGSQVHIARQHSLFGNGFFPDFMALGSIGDGKLDDGIKTPYKCLVHIVLIIGR